MVYIEALKGLSPCQSDYLVLTRRECGKDTTGAASHASGRLQRERGAAESVGRAAERNKKRERGMKEKSGS
jgi:hypothetical protein